MSTVMLKHNQKGSVNLHNNQSSYETSQPGKDFTRVRSFLSKYEKQRQLKRDGTAIPSHISKDELPSVTGY